METKNCKTCTKKVKTFATEVYCNECIQQKCCMRYTPDSIGRQMCNNIGNLIKRSDKMYCIGHYKRLLQNCKTCGEPHREGDPLGYDGWYYCKTHKPPKSEQTMCVHLALKNVMCPDLIQQIVCHI